jgi:hypothetical protein
MGYQGQAFAIPLHNSGFNDNPNVDAVPPTSFVSPTRNINLNEGGPRKRGGTTKNNATAVSGAPRLMGMFDFQLFSGSSFQVFGANDGKIYRDETTVLKTGMSTSNKFGFCKFKDVLFVADGVHRPQTWDGAAAGTVDLTSIPTDWTGSNFPGQLVPHVRGLSKRLMALVFSGTRENFYIGASDDGNDFSNANVIIMNVRTGDGYGPTAGINFGDRFLVFGKTETFILDDTSATTSNWGIVRAQWTGGAANWRLICKTGNDLIAMMEDGSIYSVTTAQTYGDYKAAILTKASFMDRWIRNNVRLAFIDDFHMVWDPTLRAVKIFVVRNGQTACDTALVFFVDRPLEVAWAIHDNQSYNSGYSASCSAMVRTSTGLYEIHTGDYLGFHWKLEQTNRNDDSNGFYGGIRLPHSFLDNPRLNKHFRRGWLITQPEGNYSLSVRWWVDGVEQTSTTVSLTGLGALFGTGVFDTDVFGGQELIDSPFELGQYGRRISIELYNNTANQDFFLSQLLIDYKAMGAKPS